MSPCKVNQTFYLVVLVVFLSCIIIIPTGAHEASPSANDTPLLHHGDNPTKNEDYTKGHSPENELNVQFLIQAVVYGFKLVYSTVSFLLWLLISPIIYLVKELYTVFLYTPSMYVWSLVSLFSPLIAFFSVAALLGVCVGATAGWFSEVIIGVLTAPSSNNDESASAELLENKRKRVAKLRRRAKALAALKARNGGRMPEEFYERPNSNSRLNPSQKGMLDGYGSDHRKGYSAGGE